MINRRFGRLLVLRESDDFSPRVLDSWRKKPMSNRRYVCLCDCGRECLVRRCSLQSAHTRSCGCIHREQLSARRRVLTIEMARRGLELLRAGHKQKEVAAIVGVSNSTIHNLAHGKFLPKGAP